MKKLLTILSALGMTATIGATVVSCGNTQSKEQSNSVSEVVKTIDLGTLQFSGKEVNKQEIADAVAKLNNIDSSKITITHKEFSENDDSTKEKGTAFVQVEGYDGYVIVTFDCEKVDGFVWEAITSEVISAATSDTIQFWGETPANQSFKDAFKNAITTAGIIIANDDEIQITNKHLTLEDENKTGKCSVNVSIENYGGNSITVTFNVEKIANPNTK